MKNNDLQDQLATNKRRAYYTMTYTGEEATQVVNFKATSSKKKDNKLFAKIIWILLLGMAAYFFVQHYL